MPFSDAELVEALSTCSVASAPGPSHMSWGLMKLFFADDAFHSQFLLLANDILTEGIWPAAFKDSVTTVVILKPRKDDYTKAKNFRPIALLECAGKLVSKLIATRLQSDAIQFDLVHTLQFGGLQFRSTTDAGFFLMEYITKARNARRATSVLALDIAQFFPSLNHHVIHLMLAKLGFSPLLCALFESYYDNRSTKYLWNVFFSKDYDTNNGVPQGDPLLPIILVLYLSAVLKVLFPFPTANVICLSYIDDFVLAVNNPLLQENIQQLQAAFTQLDQIFGYIGLNIEPSRTKLMQFAAKDQEMHQG